MRAVRLLLCGWLYRLAYRIDPGDDPNAPQCIDCGHPLVGEECGACNQSYEEAQRLGGVYEDGRSDGYRDAQYDLGVLP